MAMPILPTRSGYIEFGEDGQSVTLRPAQKEDGVTYILDCEFDPFATAPRFDAFLAEALPDEAVRNFLQEFAGYTLLGDTRHELAAWLIGEGGTGKGTFGVIMQALHRKTVALALDGLEGFKLCGLADASLVYVDETPTSRINEQALKTAISGDLMQADIKNRDPISFAPTAKWIVNGNHLPPISDHTTGFWRRFVIFPFNVKPAVKQPMLAEQIVDQELPGVLNWALTGLKRLLVRGGFPALPPAMQEFKDAAQRNADSVASWIDECEILIDEVAVRLKDDAYGYYSRWCRDHGLSPASSNKFWTRMAAALPELETSRPRQDGRQICCVNLRWIDPPVSATVTR